MLHVGKREGSALEQFSRINKPMVEAKTTWDATRCTDCSEQGDLRTEPSKAKGRFPKFQQFPEQLVIQSAPSLSKL